MPSHNTYLTAIVLSLVAAVTPVAAEAQMPPLKSSGTAPVVSPPENAAALLPTPPHQSDVWQKPTGKDAEGLPETLLTSVDTVFAQGMADPRGCPYRSITVRVGRVWGYSSVEETHGWILPTQVGTKPYAICWNGLIYPVEDIKGDADLHADMRELIKQEKALPKDALAPRFRRTILPEFVFLSPSNLSWLKIALLLRLSEGDLTRTLYATLCPDTPREKVRGIITQIDDRQDPYLSLAQEWLWLAYDRAVCAHQRGADAVAAADTALLLRAHPLVEAEAKKRGFVVFFDAVDATKALPYLTFLGNVSDLYQDSARRLNEAPLGPLDLDAEKAPPAQRIANLIQHLDDVLSVQNGQPGSVDVTEAPLCQALIAEGDAAVPALLDTIEKDKRLTRSVGFGRDFFPGRDLLSVADTARACFFRITRLSQIGDQSAVALREWWTKNRFLSNKERWFVQLADVGATRPTTFADETARQTWEDEQTHTNQRRWTEAATNIVAHHRTRPPGFATWVAFDQPPPTLPPFENEKLRAHTVPSVSDLLRRRALQLSAPKPYRWGFDFANAATVALMLYEWDPQGPATLTTLQTVMYRCLHFENQQNHASGSDDQFNLGDRIARLTLARLQQGDVSVAAEYGAFLHSVAPTYFTHTDEALLPLWQEAGNPTMRAVGQSLFNEAKAPKTPWNRLLIDARGDENFGTKDLFSSDLLRLPEFRQFIVRRLKDKRSSGTVPLSPNPLLPTAQGTYQPAVNKAVRVCDRCALALQPIAALPNFDLYAPVATRDRQCAAIAAYLETYGAILKHYQYELQPLYQQGTVTFDPIGPVFSTLNRPATDADVAEHRAVFALHRGQTRIASDLPASLPLDAKWPKDPDAPTTTNPDGTPRTWSRGRIWQAEEEWDGKQWVRYYGYVGPHSLARVPASEVQITDYRTQKSDYTGFAPVSKNR